MKSPGRLYRSTPDNVPGRYHERDLGGHAQGDDQLHWRPECLSVIRWARRAVPALDFEDAGKTVPQICAMAFFVGN
jgi:hypothetical protein